MVRACDIQTSKRKEYLAMSLCPCGSGLEFDDCCGPLIAGERTAVSAEALMRSRYAAYVEGAIPYLGKSLHPDFRNDYDEAATRRWAGNALWTGLEIVSVADGGPDDQQGTVEFVASYKEKGVMRQHHEIGQFRKLGDTWYYTEGKLVPPNTLRHAQPKTGRNDPCPCGSGKKYKKCCGA